MEANGVMPIPVPISTASSASYNNLYNRISLFIRSIFLCLSTRALSLSTYLCIIDWSMEANGMMPIPVPMTTAC